jgi:hypothetical protein
LFFYTSALFGFGWKYLKIIWLSNLLDFEWVDLKSFILAEIYKKKVVRRFSAFDYSIGIIKLFIGCLYESHRDRHVRDRMVVGFTTTCAISAITTDVVSSTPFMVTGHAIYLQCDNIYFYLPSPQ